MSSKNKKTKTKEKETTMSEVNENEVITEEIIEEAVVGEYNENIGAVVLDQTEPIVEEEKVIEPVVQTTMSNNVKDTDPDSIVLYELIEDYLNSVINNTSVNRTEENLIKFIKVAKFIAKKDKIKFIKIFFEELVQGNFKHLMAPDLVFQYINKINDVDKIKIETLYTALMTLDEFLKRPKKFGYPLDLERVRDGFTGDSLIAFIKSYLPY